VSAPAAVRDIARRRATIPGRTLRTDRYWLEPLITVVGLTAWVIYAVARTATQAYYWVPQYHYLSPFTSPCISTSCIPEASHLGQWLPAFPPLIPFAILTLPFLLGFRLTCYYYRKAYYRAFWLSPPACAVAEPHKKYSGETRFPLILHFLFVRDLTLRQLRLFAGIFSQPNCYLNPSCCTTKT